MGKEKKKKKKISKTLHDYYSNIINVEPFMGGGGEGKNSITPLIEAEFPPL